jgi:hypothetical protein
VGLGDALLTAVRVEVHDKHMQLHGGEVHVQHAALKRRWAVLAQNGERSHAHDAQVVRLFGVEKSSCQ